MELRKKYNLIVFYNFVIKKNIVGIIFIYFVLLYEN